MAITQQVQMRIMPAPSVDEAQRRMMQFIPLIFFASFYSMPSGLVLYYTCNNLFTILQQWLTRRQKDNDPADATTPAAAASDRPKAKRR
jgi:YidC/Oxa1 family membrane protein insertase